MSQSLAPPLPPQDKARVRDSILDTLSQEGYLAHPGPGQRSDAIDELISDRLVERCGDVVTLTSYGRVEVWARRRAS